MRKIDKHIIHCSDTKKEMDVGVEEIDMWHKERGWKGCGYHYVIKRDGTLEYGRPLEVIGAHCKGHNRDSIGTCLIGRDEFTPAQFITLKKVHNNLISLFKDIKIYGHRDFNPKKRCPGFDAISWHGLERVKDAVEKEELKQVLQKKHFLHKFLETILTIFKRN